MIEWLAQTRSWFPLYFRESFMLISGSVGLLGYIIFLIGYRIRHGFFKFLHFEFSIARHWILLSPFAFGAFFWGAWHHMPWYIFIFLLQGVWGMIGEVINSIWWQSLFKTPIYTYTKGAFFNNYTSVINVIPWGAGFILKSTVTKVVAPHYTFYQHLNVAYHLFVCFAILQTMFYTLRYLHVRSFEKFRYNDVTLSRGVLFFIPAFISLIYICVRFSWDYLTLSICYGIVAAIMEYSYGRFSHLFLDQRLWYYKPSAIDDGRTSFYNIPMFMLGGYWFYLGYIVLIRYS